MSIFRDRSTLSAVAQMNGIIDGQPRRSPMLLCRCGQRPAHPITDAQTAHTYRFQGFPRDNIRVEAVTNFSSLSAIWRLTSSWLRCWHRFALSDSRIRSIRPWISPRVHKGKAANCWGSKAAVLNIGGLTDLFFIYLSLSFACAFLEITSSISGISPSLYGCFLSPEAFQSFSPPGRCGSLYNSASWPTCR